MKKIISSLLLCLTILTGQAHADDNIIVIATDANWPPFQLLDIDKNIVGYEIDLISAIAVECGFKIEFLNTIWDGIFSVLESKDSHIIASCVTITEDRKKRYLFSEPIYKLVQALIVPEESLIAAPEDLIGKRIGIQIGTTALIALKQIDANIDMAKPKVLTDKHISTTELVILNRKNANFDIITYDDFAIAFKDLENGHLDAVMCDSPAARYYSNNMKGNNKKMKIGFMTDNPEYIGFVTLKSNKKLMDKLKTGHKKIIENGKQKEIFEKWFGAE